MTNEYIKQKVTCLQHGTNTWIFQVNIPPVSKRLRIPPQSFTIIYLLSYRPSTILKFKIRGAIEIIYVIDQTNG